MNQALKNLLDQYFQPLSWYSEWMGFADSTTPQPLWQYRRRYLEHYNIREQIQLICEHTDIKELDKETRLLIIIARCTLATHEQPVIGNLQLVKKLLGIMNAYLEERETIFYRYNISLFITLLIRQQETAPFALKLLRKRIFQGRVELFGETIDIFLQLPALPRPLQAISYCDLTFANLSSCNVKNVNLMGFDLASLQAESKKEFYGNNFKFTNLEYAVLKGITLKNCEFRGSTFIHSQLIELLLNHVELDEIDAQHMVFKPSKIKNVTTCRNSYLTNAILEDGEFTGIDFSNTDFQEANLDRANFTGAKFNKVSGLTAKQLEKANFGNGGCTITYRQGQFDAQALQDLNSKGIKVLTAQKANEAFSKVLQQRYLTFNTTKNKAARAYWKNLESQTKPLSNDSTVMHACLPPTDATFQLLQGFISLTSDQFSYKSMALEFARWKKHPAGTLDFFQQEWQGAPQHLGRPASISIHQIKAVHHEALWQRYASRREQIQHELSQSNTQALFAVRWQSNRKDHNFLPVLDKSTGECWLFHATSQEVTENIMKSGFSTAYATKKWLAGWGALGKGIYFSDNFAKVATYAALCAVCQRRQCQCSKPENPKGIAVEANLETPQKYWKVIIVARVILGNVFSDPHKSRKNEEHPPEGYHASWGPWIEFDHTSEFDSNEFLVSDTSQIYPEFCVYYTDNELTPTLFSQQTILPTLTIWQNQCSSYQENHPALQQVTEKLQHYHAACAEFAKQNTNASWPCWQALDNLQDALQKCYEINLPATLLTYLNDLQLNISQEYSRWLSDDLSLSSIAAFTYAYSYFQQKAWQLAMTYYDRAQAMKNSSLFIYLERGTCHFHLELFDKFIADINQAWALNAPITKHFLKSHQLAQHFCEISLTQLKQGFQDGCRHEDWVRDIAGEAARTTANKIEATNELTAKIREFEIWESHFWDLPDPGVRSQFQQILSQKIERWQDSAVRTYFLEHLENLPDEVGNRPGSIKRRQQWHQQFAQCLEDSQKSPPNPNPITVKVSWLSPHETNIDASWVVKDSPLATDLITQLFHENKEKIEINLEDTENKGRCIVKKLMRDRSILAYVKFFPYYPLRQIAIDELCYRLSGYGALSTLAKVEVESSTDKKTYPVLFSFPLGQAASNELGTSLEDYHVLGKDQAVEEHLDPYAFSWRFIETLILLLADDKADNNIPVLISGNQHYRLINIDSDEIPNIRAPSTEKLKAYSILWLTSLMEAPLHPLVIKSFQCLSLRKLFDGWLVQLKNITAQVVGEAHCLFTSNECEQFADGTFLPELETQRPSLFQFLKNSNAADKFKYKQGTISYLNAIFLEREPLSYWQQAERLKTTLLNFTTSLLPWHVLERLEPELTWHYHLAYYANPLTGNLSLTATQRFHALQGVEDQFHRQQTATLSPSSPLLHPVRLSSKSPEKTPTLVTRVWSSLSEGPIPQPIKHLFKQQQIIQIHQKLYEQFWQCLKSLESDHQLALFNDQQISNALREKLLREICWGKLSSVLRRQLLNILNDDNQLPLLRHLYVSDCPELNFSQLRSILRKKSHIEKITLINCTALTLSQIIEAVSAQLQNYPGHLQEIHFTTKDSSELSLHWHRFIEKDKKSCSLEIDGYDHNQRGLSQFLKILRNQQVHFKLLSLTHCSRFDDNYFKQILIPLLSNIEHLKLEQLLHLRNIIIKTETIGTSLSEITLNDCQNLQQLDLRLASLISLNLDNCMNLTDTNLQTPQLTNIKVSKCGKVTTDLLALKKNIPKNLEKTEYIQEKNDSTKNIYSVGKIIQSFFVNKKESTNDQEIKDNEEDFFMKISRTSNFRDPYNLKCVMLGEGKGKTDLVLKYAVDTFNGDYSSITQASFLKKILNIDGHKWTLAMWDTAGIERFHALGPIYLRDAEIAIICFSIADKDSFIRSKNWTKELRKMVGSALIILLVAVDSELEKNRAIPKEEAQAYAASSGTTYFECSIKLNKNINEIFEFGVRAAIKMRNKLEIEKLLNQSQKNQNKPLQLTLS